MSIHISALIDGELDLHEMAQAIAALPKDDEARASWHLYHVAGDAMREAMDETSELDIDVSRSVMAALSLEPTILAPHPAKSVRWQRPALALAASMAGVAWVAWVALAPIKNASGDMTHVARLTNNPLALALKNPPDQADGPVDQFPDQSVRVASQGAADSADSSATPRTALQANKPTINVATASSRQSSRQLVSANKIQLTAVESAQVARLQEYLAAHRAYHGSVLGGSANPIRTVSVASDQR